LKLTGSIVAKIITAPMKIINHRILQSIKISPKKFKENIRSGDKLPIVATVCICKISLGAAMARIYKTANKEVYAVVFNDTFCNSP